LRNGNILNALRVEAHDLLHAYRVIMELPNLTVAVSNEPVITASYHGDNISRAVVGRVNNYLLFDWLDSNFKEVTSLCIVNILEFPPSDISVTSSCDIKLLFLIVKNDFDEALMKRGL